MKTRSKPSNNGKHKIVNGKSKIDGLDLVYSYYHKCGGTVGESGFGYNAEGKLIAWVASSRFELTVKQSLEFHISHSDGSEFVGVSERGIKCTILRWERDLLKAMGPTPEAFPEPEAIPCNGAQNAFINECLRRHFKGGSFTKWLASAPRIKLDDLQPVPITLTLTLDHWLQAQSTALFRGCSLGEVISQAVVDCGEIWDLINCAREPAKSQTHHEGPLN